MWRLRCLSDPASATGPCRGLSFFLPGKQEPARSLLITGGRRLHGFSAGRQTPPTRDELIDSQGESD